MLGNRAYRGEQGTLNGGELVDLIITSCSWALEAGDVVVVECFSETGKIVYSIGPGHEGSKIKRQRNADV